LLANPVEQVTHVAGRVRQPDPLVPQRSVSLLQVDEGVPPDLRAQFDAAEDAVRAVGAVVWSMREFEADDALAAAAARYGGEVEQVRILTPDKDLGQCLEADHIVQVDVIRKRVLNEQTLFARWESARNRSRTSWRSPATKADGISRAFLASGERTASALLGRFVHLGSSRSMPGRGRHRSAAPIGCSRRCRERLADVLLYRQLATLRRDVPCKNSLEDLRYRGPDAARVSALFAGGAEAPRPVEPPSPSESA